MANTDQNKPKRKVARIATHSYIDSNGEVTDDESVAQGYSYSLIEKPDSPFIWLWSEATEDEKRMLSIFGAKTLSTNVTSGLRNNDKGEPPTAQEQLDAVVNRFRAIREGQWTLDREGGFGVNREDLVECLCRFMIEENKKTQAQVDGGWKAQALQKLYEDAAYLKQVRTNPKISAYYAELRANKSTSQATSSDLDF